MKRTVFLMFCLSLCFSCRRSKAVPEISASGTIETTEIRLSFNLGGRVAKVFLEEGSLVAAGEPVAMLDTSSLKIQLKQVEAGVKLAEAQLQLLIKGARSEDIRQVQESLKQAETGLKLAREDFARIRSLFEKGTATTKQRDDAEARHIIALAQYQTAQEALKKVSQLARPEEIRAAEARLDQAQAAVELLQKSIADCTLTASVDGIVTNRAVEPGEFAAPGATVATLSNLDRVHLMIYVKETELGRIRLGDEAEVSIDSFPDRVFPGKVVFISPRAEFTPKNIQTREERVKLVFGVKVEVENKDHLLKPGLPADALLKVKPVSAQM